MNTDIFHCVQGSAPQYNIIPSPIYRLRNLRSSTSSMPLYHVSKIWCNKYLGAWRFMFREMLARTFKLHGSEASSCRYLSRTCPPPPPHTITLSYAILWRTRLMWNRTCCTHCLPFCNYIVVAPSCSSAGTSDILVWCAYESCPCSSGRWGSSLSHNEYSANWIT